MTAVTLKGSWRYLDWLKAVWPSIVFFSSFGNGDVGSVVGVVVVKAADVLEQRGLLNLEGYEMRLLKSKVIGIEGTNDLGKDSEVSKFEQQNTKAPCND